MSAWSNRPLSSCKRQQSEACLLIFGHIANTISTIYSFLAQIAKCRRGVQSGLCLCRDYPCLQVIKQEHKVSYRCSLPLPLQKRSKDYKGLHKRVFASFDLLSFLRLWQELFKSRKLLAKAEENSVGQNLQLHLQNLPTLGQLSPGQKG